MSDVTTGLLGVRALAALLGIPGKSVTMAHKRGHLTVARWTDKGPLFDPDTARAEWADIEDHNRLQGRQPIRSNSSSGFDDLPEESEEKPSVYEEYTKARLAKTATEAHIKRIELELKRGEVVKVADVKADGARLAKILVGALAALPSRLADELATINDSHEIRLKLEEEINLMIGDIRRECGANTTEEEHSKWLELREETKKTDGDLFLSLIGLA